ncbi:MAG TPA: hypothetical protein VN452_08735 [Longilinea sp.]|nr:hypothetical protein [Longilinea sp.]
MNQPSQLSIASVNSRPLSNLFFPADHSKHWLALVLPGLGYTADMPLLYYSKMLLVNRGVDVLQLMPATRSEEFQALDAESRINWLRSEMLAGLDAGLAQNSYAGIVLVGKSIGSISVAAVLSTAESRLPTCVAWLTPLFRERIVMEAALSCKGPSFLLCGGADSTFEPDKLELILKSNQRAVALVINGADHSLEIDGEEERTFQALQQGMQALGSFLDNAIQ